MSRFSGSSRPGTDSGPGLLSIALRFTVIGAVGIATIWLSLDRMVAEKIATAIVMPTGLLWLLLLFSAAYTVAIGQRKAASLILISWMFLSLIGNGFVADMLARSLENPFRLIDPLQEEPYEAVILLGGGGGLGGNGRIQGNWAGDRLILAAQMYHQQLTKKIICTGQRIESMDSSGVDPADVSSDVLLKLGVPSDAIEKMGGRNTSEEMQNLGDRFSEQNVRVGLLTSAWHLPRALRLAERQGLSPEPLPSDFRSGPDGGPPTPGKVLESMIPSATAISTCCAVTKEYIGILAGR